MATHALDVASGVHRIGARVASKRITAAKNARSWTGKRTKRHVIMHNRKKNQKDSEWNVVAARRHTQLESYKSAPNAPWHFTAAPIVKK